MGNFRHHKQNAMKLVPYARIVVHQAPSPWKGLVHEYIYDIRQSDFVRFISKFDNGNVHTVAYSPYWLILVVEYTSVSLE